MFPTKFLGCPHRTTTLFQKEKYFNYCTSTTIGKTKLSSKHECLLLICIYQRYESVWLEFWPPSAWSLFMVYVPWVLHPSLTITERRMGELCFFSTFFFLSFKNSFHVKKVRVVTCSSKLTLVIHPTAS